MMRALVTALVLALGCGASEGPASPPPSQPDRPEPAPAPGGPCQTTEHAGTCAFVHLNAGPDAPGATEIVATAYYRVVHAEPPSADGGPTQLTTELRVRPDRLDGLRVFLEAHPEAPCRYWGMTGSCAAPSPIVEAPTYPLASTPAPAFESLRETWPQRFCAIETSGVPSAVRVETCNCGEPVSCRVQAAAGRIDLLVREDASAPAACDDCVVTTGTCPILAPLAHGHDTLRVNGRVPVRVETGDAGMLVPGACWDVSRPRR